MFTLDDTLKVQVMSQIPPGNMRNLLNCFWDQLFIYLLLSPVQYFHFHHLLSSTCMGTYGFILKTFTLLYLVIVLLFWEGLRIFAYNLFTSMATYGPVEGATRVASVVVSKAAGLMEEQGINVERIAESVANLVQKIKNQMPNAAAGQGVTGASRGTSSSGIVSPTASANFSGPKVAPAGGAVGIPPKSNSSSKKAK